MKVLGAPTFILFFIPLEVEAGDGKSGKCQAVIQFTAIDHGTNFSGREQLCVPDHFQFFGFVISG